MLQSSALQSQTPQQQMVNAAMEYQLPEGLHCSRKRFLEFKSPPGCNLRRRRVLEAFAWRRMFVDDEWIISPSLELEEVEAVVKAGAQLPPSSPTSLFDAPHFQVQDLGGRPFGAFEWRLVLLASGGAESGMWLCVPSLQDDEVQALRTQLSLVLDRAPAYPRGVSALLQARGKLHDLVAQTERGKYVFGASQRIKHVVILVVVEAEVRPILDALDFDDDTALTRSLLGLGSARSGDYKGAFRLSVVRVAHSAEFGRHYSGYTQISALAALVASAVGPSLVISFGTAGGVHVADGGQAVGDLVLGRACFFLDRLRTSSLTAYEWGLWGGGCCPAPNLVKALSLPSQCNLASQIGYGVSNLQEQIIAQQGLAALDMECASVAQVLNQAGVNYLAMKVISNGVYPGEPQRMELEYMDNKAGVSASATVALRKLLDCLMGKTVGDL